VVRLVDVIAAAIGVALVLVTRATLRYAIRRARR